MSYYEALLEALQREALHRENGEPDIALPEKQHESVPESIPITYLGACYRMKSLERRHHPYRFPELDWRRSPSSILKINDGNMTEAFVQRALIRAGLTTPDEIEVNVRIDERGVRLHGRMDARTHYTPAGEILEIKRGEKFFGNAPTPFMKYAFQVLAYGIAERREHLYVLMLEHGDMHLYRLKRDGSGWMFINDQTLEPVDAAWNKPEYINSRTLVQMHNLHRAHQDMDDRTLLAARPVEDPLNVPEFALSGDGWQCVKMTRPKGNKPGSCRAACPHSCNMDSADTVPIRMSNGRLVFDAAQELLPSELEIF